MSVYSGDPTTFSPGDDDPVKIFDDHAPAIIRQYFDHPATAFPITDDPQPNDSYPDVDAYLAQQQYQPDVTPDSAPLSMQANAPVDPGNRTTGLVPTATPTPEPGPTATGSPAPTSTPTGR